MKEIARTTYLNQLIESRGINLIKIITGLRRSGKSYLLDPIFRNYLLQDGVPEDHIVHLNLELDKNKEYRDATKLREYVEAQVKDDGEYYVLLDEIQLVPGFEGVLSGFLAMKNVDTYVTGSNSRFLSSDIVTEFRGRSEEIRMFPLSFKEFLSAYEGGDKYEVWSEYMKYGGLPLILEHRSEVAKMNFLLAQQQNIYLKDIIERYEIRDDSALKSLIEVIASSVGSLTNPYKLENAFKSMAGVDLSYNTIGSYLGRLEDAFIIEEAKRYDIKGKRYINTPQKYYFSDVGLRNSFLGFRQFDWGHIMENIVYNELRMRGYQVDVGVVEMRDKDDKKQLEIDFVANRGDRRFYIQSALTIGDTEKMEQEARSLKNVDDFFKRIILTADLTRPGYEQNGIIVMNILDFLLDEESLDREVA